MDPTPPQIGQDEAQRYIIAATHLRCSRELRLAYGPLKLAVARQQRDEQSDNCRVTSIGLSERFQNPTVRSGALGAKPRHPFKLIP